MYSNYLKPFACRFTAAVRSAALPACLAATICVPAQAQLIDSVDLATVTPHDGLYRRVLGSVGNGAWGVPVSGGFDLDGDGHADYAFAAQRASPLGRTDAGTVFLAFGDGSIGGQIDTASVPQPAVLKIYGDQVQENAGSEIWMADLTGDGLGDLIICRQNYSPGGTRIGAGAMTLIPGQAILRTMASNNEVLDLRSPPVDVTIVNVLGATAPSRLCIWARAGDITGDGVDDLAIGADREDSNSQSDSGAVYILRGGNHLETSQTIDLANFTTASPGNLARIRPHSAPSSLNYHLGATLQVADLDGNGKAEVIAAAALNRSGASLAPLGGTGEGSGGSPQGTVYISWDDNFTGTWLPNPPDFIVGLGPGSSTIIDGGSDNDVFGEELLGGKDYDNDGKADLFVGDLTADGTGGVARTNAGLGHVIYDIASLKGASFDLSFPPPGFSMATFIGPTAGSIAADTAMHGDFNGDGIDDLAFSAPTDDPMGRISAGTLHILLGQNGVWPVLSDLAPGPNYPSTGVKIVEIYGAKGSVGSNTGDILCYSGADGDINGDGITDLIMNEMEGDGSSAVDVGNLLIFDSATLFDINTDVVFEDGFE